MLSDYRMISVILCSLRRYSSSLTLSGLGSASSASFLYSPSSSSFRRSYILTSSHSILRIFSFYLSSPYCCRYFLSSWAIRSSRSFSDASFFSMSIELTKIRDSLPSTALEHLYSVFSLLMNRSHSPRNLD